MTPKETDIRALARELAMQMADEITRKLQKTKFVMSRAELAEALGYQKQSSAIEKVIADPSFPQPIEITEGGHKKWRTKDVEDWLDSRRAKESDLALAAALTRLR